MFQKKKILVWLAGLLTLFVLNVIVEAVLSATGLANTPKNDGYFIVWWMITGAWFLFGLIAIDHFWQTKTQTK